MTDTAARTLPDRVDPTALAELRGDDGAPRVLDVRTPAEFEASHIDGAINVPLDTLGEDPEAIAEALAAPTVLVCRSGARASQAHEKLSATGAADELRVLEGGMVAWEQSGFDVNKGRDRWDLERQVRFTAGSLVLGGIIASIFFPPARYFSGAIGAGLVFAAVTNTCAMGMLLSKMPWNGTAEKCDLDIALGRLR